MGKVFRLPNGVTCVTDERPQSGKVSMTIQFKSGSMHERAEENGLTFLVQAASVGGTRTRSREQIMEEIESKGGDIESSTTGTMTEFMVNALARHAGDTFDIFADMVRNPAFLDDEVQKSKWHVEQALIQQEEDSSAGAYGKFAESAYAGQAAGLNPAGNRTLLASFTPAQVRKKHAEILAHPENIVISFAGAITAAEAEKMVRKHFGDLPAAATPAKPLTPLFTGGDAREERDLRQLSVVFGFKAPPAGGHDMYAARILKELLSGGMSFQLFREIRDVRGLVYHVEAGYDASETAGLFVISALAGEGNAGEYIPLAMDLLGGVIRDGVDEVTLEQMRESILKERKMINESTEGMSEVNARQALSYGRLVPLEEWEEGLSRVTSDDVRRVCADMLRDGKYALGAVGPQDTMPEPAEIKKMMLKQLEGVTLPPAPQMKASVKVPFVRKAKKEHAVGKAGLKMTVLENGIKIVTDERPGFLSCGAWVGAGSDCEAPEINGATHMLEHMPFKGTASYAMGEIDTIVEKKLGGELNAETDKDTTAYYFYRLEPEALGQIVNICGEMVFQAKISHEDFDGAPLKTPKGKKTKEKGERDVVIEELRTALDDASDGHGHLLMATAYPDQPHGRGTLGTEATLRAMTVEQLRAHRDKYYVPNNMVFSVAGPVKHEDVVAMVEKSFGRLPAKDFPPPPKAEYKGGTAFVEHKSAEMCYVTLAAPGVAYADPENLGYEALATIMAGGGSSRLYKEIVMRQELSADVGAATVDFRTGGTFVVMSSMEPEKVKAFTSAVFSELRALCDNLTQAEVEKFKVFLEMNMLSGLERNQSVSEKNALDTLAHGRPFTIEERTARIQKLTVEDVKRAARNILASNPTLSMIVPPGTDPAYLPKHEEVVAMRDGKLSQKAAPRPKAPDINK